MMTQPAIPRPVSVLLDFPCPVVLRNREAPRKKTGQKKEEQGQEEVQKVSQGGDQAVKWCED